MRNSFYWELAVEHRDKHGDLIDDTHVLMSITKGKIDKDVRSISDNFDITLDQIINTWFVDDGIEKRGFKNYDGSTFEFVIIKNEGNDEDGILDRDWIYINPKGSQIQTGHYWENIWEVELPDYVNKAFKKLVEGESK